MLGAESLIVNGIIALIGGTVVSFADRRHKKVNKTQQHLGSPIG